MSRCLWVGLAAVLCVLLAVQTGAAPTPEVDQDSVALQEETPADSVSSADEVVSWLRVKRSHKHKFGGGGGGVCQVCGGGRPPPPPPSSGCGGGCGGGGGGGGYSKSQSQASSSSSSSSQGFGGKR